MLIPGHAHAHSGERQHHFDCNAAGNGEHNDRRESVVDVRGRRDSGHRQVEVNVASGNLLVQAEDLDIPECAGVDFALPRTYKLRRAGTTPIMTMAQAPTSMATTGRTRSTRA